MSKILKYIILLPIVYLVSIWVVNMWDTFDLSPDLRKLKVLTVEYGEYGEWYDDGIYYDTRLSVDDNKLGYVYVNRKFLPEISTPKKFNVGQDYVAYLVVLEAHSWADVFKYGSKYDYFVSSFAEGQLGEYNANDILTEEQKGQVSDFENIVYFIIGVGVVLLWLLLLYFIDKKVYSHVKEKNGEYIFNKPAWLEFITALGGSVWTVFYLQIGINFFSYGSWLYGVIFAGISLYFLSRVAKEYIDRNDEIVLTTEKICIQDGSSRNEFGRNDIESLEISKKSDARGRLEEFSIVISRADESVFKYDLVANNLQKYSGALEQTLVKLYGDKLKN